MSTDECANGNCGEPGIWSTFYYLGARAVGYSDDEAVLAAYEDFYGDLSEENQKIAETVLAADDVSVFEDAASSLARGGANLLGETTGSFFGGFADSAGVLGTVAAIVGVGALGFVAFKAVT